MEVAFDSEELNPIEFLTMLYGNIQALGKSGHGAAHEFTPFDGEIKPGTTVTRRKSRN